ncbi:MAG: 2-oxoacid:acceptor oxidoreductase subunit alpha [Opitutaceae bacterium]|nr:2-oxoacid:acceptor oxidoreductase subunit alpha [Opitutaceae bacterium]
MATAVPAPSSAPSTQGNGQTVRDVVIRLAGNSQDGIQAIGGFLARLAGRSDQEVMTFMTIPATISGGPSIFQVRMGSGEILSPGDRSDLLVAFYQHSYDAHRAQLRDGGVLLYDSDHVKPDETDKRVRTIGVPITSATVEAVGGSAKDKGKNIFVLGLLARLFNLNVEKLKGIMQERFGKKNEDILRNATLTFDSGYAYDLGDEVRAAFQFGPARATPAADARPIVTMDGNQAIVMGLITAGVRFGAAYPITPASSIMEDLRGALPKYGGLYVQAEDEIAAIAIALGFSYAGHVAVTNTSGPGMSLKMEALGWGVMAEMPLVIVNVQRGGPSTGLPTMVEQSDLLQAVCGTHGDAPRIVLAPYSVGDCFHASYEAVQLAREYSVPVILLSDQALSTRIGAFPEPDLKALYVKPGITLSAREGEYFAYSHTKPTQHVPPGTPMLGGKYPLVTGLEHDEAGHPNASPANHQKMTARRREKIKTLAATLPVPEVYGDQDGEVLLVGWGSTFGQIREATNALRAQGRKAGHLHFRHLNPLPNGIESVFARFRQIDVVEINDEGLYGYGQFATLLRARYANPAIRSICKTDGLTFKVTEILAGVARNTAK